MFSFVVTYSSIYVCGGL